MLCVTMANNMTILIAMEVVKGRLDVLSLYHSVNNYSDILVHVTVGSDTNIEVLLNRTIKKKNQIPYKDYLN